MDDILAKHLAKTLLFKENKNSPTKKEDKKSYKYKLIDGKYYVNNGSDLFISEKIGVWKNKDVVKVNEDKFIIVENSNTMIPLNHLSKEQFDHNFTRIEDIDEDENFQSKPSFLPSSKKQEFKSKINFPRKEKQLPLKTTDLVKSEKPFIKKTEEADSTQKYIDNIKNIDNSEKIEEDAEETSETNSFFDLLEKKKDDPRVKKFFNYHADVMKKEFTQILDKFKSSQMARAMESGGGTNAVQYANGGTMNGDLNVTKGIVAESINDFDGRQLLFKRTFNITGNGSNKEFTFNHNLNTKDILINVYDSVTSQLVFVTSVNTDSNNTTITFPNNLEVGQNYRVILIA
jgi:hypothetical protein